MKGKSQDYICDLFGTFNRGVSLLSRQLVNPNSMTRGAEGISVPMQGNDQHYSASQHFTNMYYNYIHLIVYFHVCCIMDDAISLKCLDLLFLHVFLHAVSYVRLVSNTIVWYIVLYCINLVTLSSTSYRRSGHQIANCSDLIFIYL